MSEAQNIITAIVRLLGLVVGVRGLLGFAGVALTGGGVIGPDMPRVAPDMVGTVVGASLVVVVLGVVVFLLARPVARLVTFDMN